MSTVYSDQYQQAYVTVPVDKIDPPDHESRVRFSYFSYTAAGALVISTIIKLCKIPKGARVLDAVIKSADLGTVGTLDLGWAASAELDSTGTAVEASSGTGFINAMDVHTAADVIKASDNQAAPAGVLKKFSAEVDLQINVSAATDAAGAISGYIAYVL